MSDVKVTLDEGGGEVTVEGLDGKSYSHVNIDADWTTFSIKGTSLRVGFKSLTLTVDGDVKYEESWA